MGRLVEGPLTLRGSQGLENVSEEVKVFDVESVHFLWLSVRNWESSSGATGTEVKGLLQRCCAVALNGGVA